MPNSCWLLSSEKAPGGLLEHGGWGSGGTILLDIRHPQCLPFISGSVFEMHTATIYYCPCIYRLTGWFFWSRLCVFFCICGQLQVSQVAVLPEVGWLWAVARLFSTLSGILQRASLARVSSQGYQCF